MKARIDTATRASMQAVVDRVAASVEKHAGPVLEKQIEKKEEGRGFWADQREKELANRLRNLKCSHTDKIPGSEFCSPCWFKMAVKLYYSGDQQKESNPMAMKTGVAKKAAAAEKGTLNKSNVMEEWGKAFTKHGKSPNAVKLIVEHMKSKFPERSTDWEGRVDGVRGNFNRGELPNCAAPAEPLPRFGSEKASKKSVKKTVKKESAAA